MWYWNAFIIKADYCCAIVSNMFGLWVKEDGGHTLLIINIKEDTIFKCRKVKAKYKGVIINIYI